MDRMSYSINGPWPGKLAIASRPRGGDWLEDDIHRLSRTGVDVLVSALTEQELEELLLQKESAFCARNDIEFISFPIEDRGVPDSHRAATALWERLGNDLELGKSVAVHCRMGIGRSSLIAAGLLIHAGLDVDEAFETIEQARGCPVPDTMEQREWVRKHFQTEAITNTTANIRGGRA